ncbi:MAG: glutamate-5-semialdehyde dehydrogenase [Bdellovibrionales bacterium RIFOXYD12_FULL_39_22]|nr:MAG: glutamate-5-semialdehyde dehydrogenase [Bdellovibrionales bacterium RIFOXYB1_FULL_39_21]OFZ41100.1 MAG: glutamate-5-semialdehyde dehydrogenase [Bdellovibrionales bacterium RIFOXYC12_FULL_39_17]OFZ50313.1 MAG: glutamate-5-semialdehyde dehydrogenase [Bdellovibrionales bacterium RIFOXYC1_FULL_39_130]OFZ75114.1 MAG: glutamate-5-semialdehyde dehydrogenase [Bdellovibrionales bacterium RIFOXYD1_FULL_39_84]OFZ92244.1 MAG: glutamate-5-semialdehyde dehydrogenase [Bdellovibrionales bacterium RIFOX
MDILQLAKKAKEAENKLRHFSSQNKTEAILSIAAHLQQRLGEIIAANKQDIETAQANNLSSAMIDRLTLNEQRVMAMINSAKEIANQEDPAYKIIDSITRPNGLVVKKQLVPIGVVAMIFESRPNVVIDAAALAIRSSNILILKGGKEAHHSNKKLAEIVIDAITPHLCPNVINMVSSKEEISQLIKLNQYIDLIIPRGGEKLVNFIIQNSSIPVIAHNKGLCHTYIHFDADYDLAEKIALNAKVQRPGVCNATETLLIHNKWPSPYISQIIQAFLTHEVEIRGCPAIQKYDVNIKAASEDDWNTEYLSKILSIKIVDSLENGIAHIQRYGSKHTEAFIGKEKNAIAKFQQEIDASCIVINSSTRFNDGGELGLGAELGISTNKLHAYGPMGARELTIPRFVVIGQGQIRK